MDRRSRLLFKRPVCTALLIFGFALSILIPGVLTPWNLRNLSSNPKPVSNYAEAVQRIELLRSVELLELNPDCRLQFLTYGQKVDRAIILVHGYTECPSQFAVIGQRFFELGYNVLIAPLPHHGLADRMTDSQALLTAEELAVYADSTVDIAQGLGERVAMMGLSGGGVITAWAAQHRSDLDVAVIISPGFGFKQVPTGLTAAAMNLYSILPNSYRWWNAELQAEGSPAHQYPRYSTRALVQTVRLGYAVRAGARQAKPVAQKLVVVLNGGDFLVNNEITLEMVKIWQKQGGNLDVYEFDADLNLPHDIIDLSPEDPRTETVHSRLVQLTNQ